MGQSRRVVEDECDDNEEYVSDSDYTAQSEDAPNALLDQPSVIRMNVIQSPFLTVFYSSHPIRFTLDTGATTNMIKASVAKDINLPISPASQMACQADGVTPLDVVSEVHCHLSRDHSTFQLDALVVRQLDVDVLAGNPFLVTNDIATRPAKRQIVITDIIHYGPQGQHAPAIRHPILCSQVSTTPNSTVTW